MEAIRTNPQARKKKRIPFNHFCSSAEFNDGMLTHPLYDAANLQTQTAVPLFLRVETSYCSNAIHSAASSKVGKTRSG